MVASHFFRKFSIPLLLAALVGAITFLLFVDVSKSESRTLSRNRINPYVLCTTGTTIISEKADKKTTLRKDERRDVQAEDRIRTLASSTAIVFWADGSVTRLGEKTNISLLELRSDPRGSTQVEISLSEGKTWTNIVRMLDPESSFKQRFDNDQKVAAVRGTQFGINLDEGYLQTQSHAVDVTDLNWEVLTTIPAGKAISVTSVFDLVSPDSLDSTWQALNTASDAIIAQERVQALQQDLRSFIKDQGLLSKIQEQIRSFFGLSPIGNSIAIDVTNGVLSVKVDPSKLSTQDTENLKTLYEKLSNLDVTSANIASKSQVESSLLALLPEAEAKKYEAIFARSSLYDSWKAIELGLPKDTVELRNRLEKYTKNSGIADEIIRIQESLPESTINSLNKQLDLWKSSGLETTPMGEWFNKSLKTSTEDLGKIGEAATKGFDEILENFSAK
jgi:hypothetical protein